MILVTVGTHTQGFRRLLEAVDRCVESGIITQPVEAQIGATEYAPRAYAFARHYPFAEFARKIAGAELVVTHAGAGIIITCRKLGKRMVVAPRLRKYGEHTNDHQLALARQVEEEGLAPVVYEMEDLPRALAAAGRLHPTRSRVEELPAARIIEGFLARLGHEAGDS